jgi:hypothetical protein
MVRELLAPSAFISVILVLNYAMSSLPNVKLFDLLVFVAGYTLGMRRGATVAVAAWLVYGQVNPWGVANAPLLMTLMASEILYAGAGAGIRYLLSPDRVSLKPSIATWALLASALVVTPLYDVVTNVYTGLYWANVAGANEYGRWLMLALLNPGALFFMAVHVGSNALLFPIFGPPLIHMTLRAKERLDWR